MVTLVGSQIWWTWETEDVFRRVRDGKKHAMKDFAAKLTGQLSELTAMVGGSGRAPRAGPPPLLQRVWTSTCLYACVRVIEYMRACVRV